MGLCDDVREHCALIAAEARHVRIDPDALEALDPGEPPAHDPAVHHIEGRPEEVAAYFLTFDAINFGSGWFPTLRKRPGLSGALTVASALRDRFRTDGPWSPAELRELDAPAVAGVLGQDPAHELMALYARALNELGSFLGHRGAVDLVAEAAGSAERLAELVARGMPMWDDEGFWKRAQILPSDLALAGVAEFADIDRLTIFADNLVPHVLRMEGVLVYDPELAAHIDREELLPPGRAEQEIRACAVQACERIAQRTGVAPRLVDVALWTRGQRPEIKAVPRHRTRCIWY
jgi:Queuosine salvage protein